MYICVNEILHNLTSQLWSDLDHGRDGYPDQALIEGMLNKARVWGCEQTWRGAMRVAIEQCVPSDVAYGMTGSKDDLHAAVKILASDRRREFLAELFLRLTSAARALSPPSDPDLISVTDALTCTNELLLLVAEQLRADLDPRQTAHADAEFIESLISAANTGGCGGNLRYLLERTLAAVAKTS
jgi:hypothetical protein